MKVSSGDSRDFTLGLMDPVSPPVDGIPKRA